ncbi:hypothetical protein KIW84_077135 [Lathyrus oleraceus]|uniref:Uncharacterized protein n=1 Tax=Pisum sativum TaxID=3888 RepID=A0A9D5A0B4_PEA|nr:hypothetical protein KIW84_077135 [Pisum sativum]
MMKQVEDHDEVFCIANVNCNFASENNDKMNTDDQDLAQHSEKNSCGVSSGKLINEESSCPVGESDIGDFTVKCEISPILKSPTASVSPRISTSRKSLRTSSGVSPSETDVHVENELGIKTGNLKSSATAFSSQAGPSFLTKIENLAASIRHGLEIIDSHRSAALKQSSSYRFSLRPRESRPTFPVDKVDVGVQTFLDDNVEEDSSMFTCINCKNRAQLDVNEINNSSNLQLACSQIGATEKSNGESTTSLTAPASESSTDNVSGSKQLPDNKESSSSQNLDNYANVGLIRDTSPSYAPAQSQQQDSHDMPGFSAYDPPTGYDIPYFRPNMDETSASKTRDWILSRIEDILTQPDNQALSHLVRWAAAAEKHHKKIKVQSIGDEQEECNVFSPEEDLIIQNVLPLFLKAVTLTTQMKIQHFPVSNYFDGQSKTDTIRRSKKTTVIQGIAETKCRISSSNLDMLIHSL